MANRYTQYSQANPESMFVPQNLDLTYKALENKQHQYDVNEETGNALKDYILKTPGLTEEDRRANQVKAQEVDKAMDNIHDKYKGDLTQATSDIKNLVRKYKYDPELQARTNNYNSTISHFDEVEKDKNLSQAYKAQYKKDVIGTYGATRKQEDGTYNQIKLPGYDPIVDESKKIGEFLDKAKANTKEYYDKVHGIGGYEQALTKHSKEELDYNTLMDAGAQFIASDPELSKSFNQRGKFENDNSYNSGLYTPVKNKDGSIGYAHNMDNPAMRMLHANASIRAYKKETLDSNLFNDKSLEDDTNLKKASNLKVLGDAYIQPLKSNATNLKGVLDNLYDSTTGKPKALFSVGDKVITGVANLLNIGSASVNPEGVAKIITEYNSTNNLEDKQKIVDNQINKLRNQYSEISKAHPKTSEIKYADGTHSDTNGEFLKSLYTAMENNDATASYITPITNTKVNNNIRRQLVGEVKDLGDGKKVNSGLGNTSNLSIIGQGRLDANSEKKIVKQLGYDSKESMLANAEVIGIPGFDFTQEHQGGVAINIPSKDASTSETFNLPPNEAVKGAFRDVDNATKAMREGKTISTKGYIVLEDNKTHQRIQKPVTVKYHPAYDKETGLYTCTISKYDGDRPIQGSVIDIHDEYAKAFEGLNNHLNSQYTGK